MAWFHPEWYRRVLSYSGTFVNQARGSNPAYPRGAWEYHATLFPNAERKPLRIWMHVSELDNGADRDESITNNQHAQVDEGDIVKLHGEHLIVLRRGRLFTISLDGERLRQSKMLDAFGPDIDPRGSWYDEIVVDGDNVVVVGFSYQRGGTEVGLFKIDADGVYANRTPVKLGRSSVSVIEIVSGLAAGDRVRFHAVSKDDFLKMRG